jgi:hypothetical protein
MAPWPKSGARLHLAASVAAHRARLARLTVRSLGGASVIGSGILETAIRLLVSATVR